MPEVIFGEGKTPRQVAEIFSRLAKHGENVLATRVAEGQSDAVAHLRKQFKEINKVLKQEKYPLHKEPESIPTGFASSDRCPERRDVTCRFPERNLSV